MYSVSDYLREFCENTDFPLIVEIYISFDFFAHGSFQSYPSHGIGCLLYISQTLLQVSAVVISDHQYDAFLISDILYLIITTKSWSRVSWAQLATHVSLRKPQDGG